MLDSRRDRRYRRVAHRSIRVGLRKVTFHDIPGTSSGIPGFPLTLIHRSAWNMNSANFALTEFSESRLLRGHALRCGSWHHTYRWEGFDPLGS